MPDISDIQTLLSENLLFFQKHKFRPPVHNYSLAQLCCREAPRKLKLLRVIASVFATGNGDFYAATFEPPDGTEVIIAKNGKPTEADIRFAEEFFALLLRPEVSVADIFPCLLARGQKVMNKRIRKLHAFVSNDKLAIGERLDEFARRPSPVSEGRSSPSEASEKSSSASNISVIKEHLHEIEEYTKVDLSDKDSSSAASAFFRINTAANAFARSPFMEHLVNCVEPAVRLKAPQFVRNVEKLGRYYYGVKRLIKAVAHWRQQASYRWVNDDFYRTGEAEVQLNCKNTREVILRSVTRFELSAEHMDRLNWIYPSNRRPWEETLQTYLHPEIRLILHLRLDPGDRTVRPIGTSKLSCWCCRLWVKAHNADASMEWMIPTSRPGRRDGKVDASFALPGEAYPEIPNLVEHRRECGKNPVDRQVMDWVLDELYDKAFNATIGNFDEF